MFVLAGACGQRIYVDPRSKLVMVNTAEIRAELLVVHAAQ
jgi:hypothetical protein